MPPRRATSRSISNGSSPQQTPMPTSSARNGLRFVVLVSRAAVLWTSWGVREGHVLDVASLTSLVVETACSPCPDVLPVPTVLLVRMALIQRWCRIRLRKMLRRSHRPAAAVASALPGLSTPAQARRRLPLVPVGWREPRGVWPDRTARPVRPSC